jgi:hypothetical protein
MFTSIRRARALRRAPVLLGGLGALVFLGATITGPIAASTSPSASSSQTRSVSCNAYAFRPIDSATGSGYAGAKRIRAGTGGSGFFTCDPGLPNRAVVTKVRFSIWDGSGSSQVKFCGLYRSGLTESSFDEIQELASMPGTGISHAPGFARLTDTSIQHATVNTASYVYELQCNLEQAGQSLGLFGADVTYSISLHNG